MAAAYNIEHTDHRQWFIPEFHILNFPTLIPSWQFLLVYNCFNTTKKNSGFYNPGNLHLILAKRLRSDNPGNLKKRHYCKHLADSVFIYHLKSYISNGQILFLFPQCPTIPLTEAFVPHLECWDLHTFQSDPWWVCCQKMLSLVWSRD